MTGSLEAIARDADDRSPAARLLSSLHEVRVLWREVTRLSFPGGVSGLAVLHLIDQEGAVRVSDLAACGHVGVSTMSRQVAELTTAGLVERDLAPGDARAHLVRITDAGRAELTRARTAVLERLAPALDGWTEPELAELERQLTRLTHDLAALSGRAPERT
jgi:DNA-binding MarR family transcriptional regulator